jgi:hypothetical protein
MKKLLLLILLAQATFAFAQNIDVSGAGSSQANGIYTPDGMQNGKPKYVKIGDPDLTIYWDFGWYIESSEEGGPLYIGFDFEDLATPDLVTEWDIFLGDPPLPLVTASITGPSLSYSGNRFTELVDNNGAIENQITITYNGFNGDFLTGSINENYIATGKVSASNVPAGLTAQVVLTAANQLTLSLLGQASANTAANNISNLTLQFENSAFNNNAAVDVSGYLKNDFQIRYRTAHTVCASGCNFNSIQTAINTIPSGDIISLSSETYTGQNISINNKQIVIQGISATQTIIQASATPNTATSRVMQVSNSGGHLIIKDVTIRHGKIVGGINIHGAGIWAFNSAKLEMYRCAVVDNIANNNENTNITTGGGVSALSVTKLIIEDCLIANNQLLKSQATLARGGGVYINYIEGSEQFKIINTTFSGNTLTASNSTAVGGGLAIGEIPDQGLLINNCTFTNNSTTGSGGGVAFAHSGNAVSLRNSIIFGNTAATGADYFRGAGGVVNAFHNITGVSAAASGNAINGTNTNNSNSNPLLQALANNGGPTQTRAIASGSPAINGGDAFATSTDQRGLFANGTRDIGAFEFDGLTAVTKLDQTIIFDALANRTYGDAGFDLTATASSGLPVSYQSSNNNVATISGSTVTIVGAGTTNITATQDGDDAYNPADPVIRSITVEQRTLSVTAATASNKVYDGTDFADVTVTAFSTAIGGDDVSIDATGAFVATTVGTEIAVSPAFTLSGDDAANYSLNQSISFSLVADITPATLSITAANAANKEYDRNTAATLTGTLSGVVGSDDVSVLLSAAFNDFNVGLSKPLTSTSTLTGEDAFNYILTQPSGLTADITAKELTLSAATAQNKSFDGSTNATVTGTLSGVIVPDLVDFDVIANFSDPGVGTNKPVTATIDLTGTNAGNYTIAPISGLTADIEFGACGESFTGSAFWDFTTSSISSDPIVGLSISTISRGNNDGTTALITSGAASSGYAGASGGNNAGAAARTGALNTAIAGSAYFEFSLNPPSFLFANVSSMSFGSQSTSTGPQAFSIRSSADGFASDLASGSLSNNSAWTLRSFVLAPHGSALGEPLTYRIYGHNGAGATATDTANWRIDDLTLGLTLGSSPILSSERSTQVCSGTPFNYSPESSPSVSGIVWTRASVIGISNTAVTTPQGGSINETLINTTNSLLDVIYLLSLETDNCFATDELIVSVKPDGGTLTIGQISGDIFQSCSGVDNASYSIAPVSGATTYAWATTGGITISGGQGSTAATFNFPIGFTVGTVRVRASNPCAQSIERVLTIRSAPAGTPGAISGATTSICANSSRTYSINPVGNTESYEWKIVGSGASFSSVETGTSVELNFSTGFTSAILQVRAINSCGTSGWRSLTISSGVDALGIPGVINGPTQGCPSSTETYSLAAMSGATNYIWRTTGGIVISNGQGTNSVEMSFPTGFLSGSIFVKMANVCGETRESRINITGAVKSPGPISGQSTFVCANATKTYSIAPVAGATSYLWSATGDVTLNSSNGIEAVFDFGPSFVSGTIEVQAVNGCGPSAVRKLTVRSNIPARPGSISGIIAGLCANQSTNYSISPVSFASNYVWTWVGDLDVTAGQGSLSATFSAGSGFENGQVIVQAANICGISLPRVLNVRSTPVRPSTIIGPGPDVLKGAAGLNYSINAVTSATQYNWSGTNGISIATGNGSTAVTADITPNFSRGVIQVTAVNACGEGPARVRSLRGIDPLPFMRGSLNTAPEINIYPNPAKNKVIVQGSGITQIQLYDVAGKLLQAHRYQDAFQEEIMLNYPQGMYIIQVFGAGWNTQHKVVVQ